MGTVYTTEEFQKLNPKNLIRWDELVDAEFQKNWSWELSDATSPLNNLSAQSRLFYPRSFSVSASFNALNSPWYIDYGHLMFWFFFLSTFIIVMWIVTLHSLTSRNIETRFPRRETRGFSRAQTGDVMTAVLPLTWSITMLMHASTHSINFDENTAATVFSFTVVAYQWGWNYYFPRDIVDKLARGPRIVGRGGIDKNKNHSDYSLLLERARYDYMARLAARGLFSEKNGKEVISNVLNLYARAGNPAQTMSLQSEIQLLTSAYTLSTWVYADDIKSLWHGTVGNLPVSYKNPTSLNLPSSAASWLLSSFGKARYISIDKPGDVTTNLIKLAYPYFSSSVQQSYKINPYMQLRRDSMLVKESQPLRYVGNTTRSLASLSLLGNRLGLIHKHLSNSSKLPNHLTAKRQIAFKIFTLLNNDKNFTFMHKMQPRLTMSPTSSPVTKANLTPNLWLLTKKTNPKETLIEKLTPRSTLPLKVKHESCKLLNLLTPTYASNLYTGYVSLSTAQKKLFAGSPYSLASNPLTLISVDDLGITSSAVLKELNQKLASKSAIANSFVLKQALTNANALTVKNLSTQVKADANNKLIGAYLASNSYNAVSNLPTLPTTTRDRFGWFLQSQAVAQGAKTHKQAWFNAILPRSAALTTRHDLIVWCGTIPTTTTSPLSLEAKVVNPAFFAKHYLAPNEMSAKSLFANTTTHNPSTSQTFNLDKTCLPLNTVTVILTNVRPLILQKETIFTDCTAQKLINQAFSYSNYMYNHGSTQLIETPTKPYRLLELNTALKSRVLFNNFLNKNSRLKPLWTQNVNLSTKPNWPGLVTTKNLISKNPSTPWLEGPTEQRPVRSSADRSSDPINFAGKFHPSTGQPFFTNNALAYWYWNWTNTTLNFALPLYKFHRGGFVKKPATGFWQTNHTTNFADSSIELATNLPRVDKGFFNTDIMTTTFIKHIYSPHMTSFALIDSEWSMLAHTPAVLTPEPGEDIDQAFNHQKWTIDINTTRRSDHNSKFKVTWGPWATLKRARLDSKEQLVDANFYAGITGVSAVQGLPLRATQKIALLNENVLPFKTSAGLSQVSALSAAGELDVGSPRNPMLLNPLRPQSSFGLTALANTKLLSKLKPTNGLNLNKHLPLDVTPWSQFWTLKQKIDDGQILRNKVNTQYSPSYWTDKALLALNNKRLQVTKITNFATPLLYKVDNTAVGAAHPLLFDLKAAANYNDAYTYSTSSQSWFDSYSSSTLGLLLNKCSDTLEKTVESHLISRANYSLALDEIGSIRRLRVTKGVYLPSDVPMHVVCGSKDVIHSWALPGLNIKIDCIPGFNSHRRLLLRWRGAYWGQCMEVCGRYHHWMPILIHVVHKDIFLSWCLVYLRLVDAKVNENARGLALIASVDLLGLDSTLASLLTPVDKSANLIEKVNAFLVSSDLDE